VSGFGIPALDESSGARCALIDAGELFWVKRVLPGRKGGAGDADASDDWVVEGEGASGLLEGFEVADGEGCCAGSLPGCCPAAMVCTPYPPIYVAVGFLPALGTDPSIFAAGYLVLVS